MKMSSETVDWVCVDGFGYARVEFNNTKGVIDGDVVIDTDLFFAWSNKNIVPISDVSALDLLMNRHKLCKKIETPEQRREREELEAAYDLYTHVQSTRDRVAATFEWFLKDQMRNNRERFLIIVRKTGYTKER